MSKTKINGVFIFRKNSHKFNLRFAFYKNRRFKLREFGVMIIGKSARRKISNEMQKCQKCNYENADAMSFCLQCGTPLVAATMAFNLPDSGTQNQPAPGTAFNKSAETIGGGQPFPANFATVPTARPKSGKKIFLILGGVTALFGLLFVAGALIVYFNWKSRNTIVTNANVSLAPIRGIAGRSPSPKSSASPSTLSGDAPPATPQVSFTPPIEPTKKGAFTVYANGGWQLSEIDTVPLENFRTSAQGLIDLAAVKTGVSTKGVADAKTKSRRIYAEHPTGALMMRTRYSDGKYSNVQPVTAAPSVGVWRNFPDERGRLEFCINDNAPEENGGQFTVTVTLTSVPKAKK